MFSDHFIHPWHINTQTILQPKENIWQSSSLLQHSNLSLQEEIKLILHRQQGLSNLSETYAVSLN